MADDIAKQLAATFPPEAISWRVGATNREKTRGLALAYIDARDVMNRLDDVLGIFGWKSEHSVVGNRTICRLSILNPETREWVSRTDGAGDTDVEAEKGAFSDSLKRCAVAFGIGRYLYGVDAPWVELEQKGNTHIIPERELAKLRARLGGKAAPTTDIMPPRPASKLPPAVPRHPAAPDPHASFAEKDRPQGFIKEPAPISEDKQLTLSQIRDGILGAILKTESEDRIRGIFASHRHDMDTFMKLHRATYNRIVSVAKDHAKNIGGNLDDWELLP